MAISFDHITIDEIKKLIIIKNQDGKEESFSISGTGYSVFKCLCKKGEAGANVEELYEAVFIKNEKNSDESALNSKVDIANVLDSFKSYRSTIVNRLNKILSDSEYGRQYRIKTDRATQKTKIHILPEFEMDKDNHKILFTKIKKMAEMVDEIEAQNNATKIEKLFLKLMKSVHDFIKMMSTNKGSDAK